MPSEAAPKSRESGLFTRLISGDGIRATRFHNYKGELVAPLGALYLPLSFATALFRKSFASSVALPWISWRAIRKLDSLIQRDWKVLEFGSGMSSVWLASRCGRLVTIEHDEAWHSKVSALFSKRGVKNVTYLRREEANYLELGTASKEKFDFILVDGIRRHHCAELAIQRLKPGGYVYLDNSDVYWNDYADAEKILLTACAQQKGQHWYFTDFFPGNVAVSQGLFVQLPGSTPKP